MKKKIVVIGGGNGSTFNINALKLHVDKFKLSAVISMSDSGGSSGKLREEFKTLPPGDIMRAVLAMSKYKFSLLRKIFYRTRYEGVGKLESHNLGNLFLTLAAKYGGNYINAVRALEQSLDVVGKVYPATLDSTHLVVELTNGDVVKTESKIDRPDYDRSLKIKKAWLEPVGKILSEVKEVVEEADYILVGPGSLYTSVVAALLPDGMFEAIKSSRAKIVFVAGDVFEAKGETGPETLSGLVKELQNYLPRKIDHVVYNNGMDNKRLLERYKERDWGVVECDKENIGDYNVTCADFERSDGGLDSDKLSKILINII